jgi:FkbM family methyltransferase
MIKNNFKNIYFFWIINLLDLIKAFFNKNNRFCIFNLNIFIKFFNFLIIFDKNNKKFFKIYFKTFFDLITIRNCFFIEEYNILKLDYFKKILNSPSKKKKLIVDCGSNIGCSSLFFNKIFLNSTLICIEPDKINFSLLKKNCDQKEFHKINSAIMSKNYTYKNIYQNDNRANFVVKTNKKKNKSVTINDVLKKIKDYDYDYFLIKIDIEGSENDLFSKNYDIIKKFKIIIIELHDWLHPGKNISKNFLKFMNKQNNSKKFQRDIITFGENLIAVRSN